VNKNSKLHTVNANYNNDYIKSKNLYLPNEFTVLYTPSSELGTVIFSLLSLETFHPSMS